MGIFKRTDFNTHVPYNYTQPQSGGTARRKTLLIGLAVVLVIFVLAVLSIKIFRSSNNTPSKYRAASDKFVSYVVSGDASSSYKMFSVQAQKADPENNWTSFVSKIKGFYSKETYKNNITATPETIMIYQATGKDGAYIFYVKLIKESGTYKVNSFNATPGVYVGESK